MRQGQTGPYLCAADDGNLYIVKGPNTTYLGLIYEWVCGHLGLAIGLPVPALEIAYVDSSLLEYGGYDFTEGDWFASKYVENIQDVPFELVSELDVSKLKLLFLFDYWIKNGDRVLGQFGGNPNLFIRSDLSTFVVLDHNMAFERGFDENFEKDKMEHVGASAWFSVQLDLYEKQYYEGILDAGFAQIDTILNSVPPVWVDASGENNVLTDIKNTLERFKQPEFWEGIK
ncbi:hypothetical protein GBN14_02530 [Plesiomonas shigelloides]|nr:hypothetical protein GBN14_02530 [Plesiomonas shigelloides]